MKNGNYFICISHICCGMIICIGILTFVGLLSGQQLLASISPHYIPMAPNTAAAFIALGISIPVFTCQSFYRVLRLFSALSAICVIALSILTLIQYFICVDLGIDQMILKTSGVLNKVPVGYMSPITGGNFLLSGVSFLLLILPSHGRRIRNIASCLAVVTTITGLVVMLGYLYGTPILYGGNTVPMAVTTASAFICLGIALIATADSECLPVSLFTGSSTRARLMRAFFPIPIILVLVEDFLHTFFIARMNFNPALVIAISALVFASIVGVFVLRRSKTMGDNIDRIETMRKRAEGKIQILSQAIEQSPAIVMITDVKGHIEYVNHKFTQLAGYTSEEVMGKNTRFFKSGKTPPEEYGRLWETITSGNEWNGTFCNRKKNGEIYWEMAKISPVKDGKGNIINFIALKEDVTELKQTTEKQKESEEKFRLLFESSQEGIFSYDTNIRFTLWNKAMEQISGFKREQVLGNSPFGVFPFLDKLAEKDSFINAIKGKTTTLGVMPYDIRETGKHGYFESSHFPLYDVKRNIIGGMAIIRDVTRRWLSEQHSATQHTIAKILAESETLDDTASKIIQAICKCIGWSIGELWMVDNKANVLRYTSHWHSPETEAQDFKSISKNITFLPGIGLPGRVWASGKPVWVEDVVQDNNFLRASIAAKEGLHGAFGFPIVSGGEILGVMSFFCHEIKPIDEDLLNMLGTIDRQVGLFVRRKQAEEYTRVQLKRIEVLHDIDKAIATSLDLKVVLDVILEKIYPQLQVDAIDVLLYNPNSQTLEYASGRGFRVPVIQCPFPCLSEDCCERAVFERRTVCIPDINEVKVSCPRARFLISSEAFIFYIAVPLIARGQMKGVLEIFNRTSLNPGHEWMNFLDILAGQAAIAIDKVDLFESLQRSHFELSVAYEKTIEGWSRALDMRDKETEGHTRRVTEITLKLARNMGISKKELAHMRRGALLHDIGKMGIPDSILLKPDVLTEEERKIMVHHTTYAYEFLSPISYLRPALDIPYCHHEKWDGTGYPRGLRGEQIPLAARIFAVVDVWDALRSDRLYRKGLSEEETREYIRSHVGTHFDPKVVEMFLKMEL